MKKAALLLLTLALAFTAAHEAKAIEFKAKGQFIMNFDYGQAGKLSSKARPTQKNPDQKSITGFGGGAANTADEFGTNQRVRLQLTAIASEALSGTVWFEIGDQQWGNAADRPGGKKSYGGALGSDGNAIELKNAYIDWTVPNTDLKLRMGIQELNFPNFVARASNIFQDDVAGITASYKINDNFTTTAMWLRPYNDNYKGYTAGPQVTGNYMDNMDMFALLAPMTFDGLKITPWAMYSAIGPNVMNPYLKGQNGNTFSGDGSASAVPTNTSGAGTQFNDMGNGATSIFTGLLPSVYATKNGKTSRLTDYGNAFWGSVTGQYTGSDPFLLSWLLSYGNVSYDKAELNRSGWEAWLLGEYKMDWGIPGLFAWYSSGDNGDIKSGSQRMPTVRVTTGNTLSKFASNGTVISRKNVVTSVWTGTWGAGLRIRDIKLFDDIELKHIFRVTHIRGSNDPVMAKYILGKKAAGGNYYTTRNATDFNAGTEGVYLTTRDSATEFGLTNEWKIYPNLRLIAEGAYILLDLDQSKSVWGGGNTANGSWIGGITTHDAWQANLSLFYEF